MFWMQTNHARPSHDMSTLWERPAASLGLGCRVWMRAWLFYFFVADRDPTSSCVRGIFIFFLAERSARHSPLAMCLPDFFIFLENF